MNQIPNIEETHNTEVEEVVNKIQYEIQINSGWKEDEVGFAGFTSDGKELIAGILTKFLHHQLQKAREQSGKRNAVVKEYKDEGVMFILKIEDGKTYEASMPIPKWAEIGKLTLRDHSELDQDK